MYGLTSTKQAFANLISGGLVFESSTCYRALLKKLAGDPQSRVNSCKTSERESKINIFFRVETVSRHAGRLVGVEEQDSFSQVFSRHVNL